METFCDMHAPGLFEDIFRAIFNDEKERPTTKRSHIQRIRVVALLHNLSFFRNQVLHLSSSHRRWHPFYTRTQKANKLNNKYVLAHVHSSSRYPHWHQCCTSESGYQQKPPDGDSNDERWINSTLPWRNWHSASAGIFSCRVDKVFFFQLPVFITCSKQCACDYKRVYWDAERHEMETLKTSWLVDEFERTLHSKNDYAAALEHTLMMCPELHEYMAEFQLVVTGDYPTWWDKLLQLLFLHCVLSWWKFWQLVTVNAKGIHDLHQLPPQKLWQGNLMSAKWPPVPCVPKHRPWWNNPRIPIWAVPQLIRTIAHALSGRRFDVEFMEWFLPQYLRGHGHKNLTDMTLKSAEFLFELFSEVWMTLGQTVKVPRGNRKFQVLCI